MSYFIQYFVVHCSFIVHSWFRGLTLDPTGETDETSCGSCRQERFQNKSGHYTGVNPTTPHANLPPAFPVVRLSSCPPTDA
uniref:Oxidoreductase n=1 Tax=Rhizophora mucronata TaxID=61149 RepID=A0A2P2KG65_RHIMU